MLIEKCRREIRQWEIEQIKDFETFHKMRRSGGFSQFDFYGADEREWDEDSPWEERVEATRESH